MDFFRTKYAQAVQEIDLWLDSLDVCSEQVAQSELREMGFRNFQVGWKISGQISGGGCLLLLLDGRFPYSLPRVAILDRPDALGWPHVEHNKLLCLAGDNASIQVSNPVDVVKDTLIDAQRFFHDSVGSQEASDYSVDFEAYWRREVEIDTPHIRALLANKQASRIVKAWHGTQSTIIAENGEDLQNWLDNRYGKKASRTFGSAAFIWLNTLPTPHDYPKNGTQFRRYLRKHSPEGVATLERLLRSEPAFATVIVAGETGDERIALGGLEFVRPARSHAKGDRVRAPLSKGFRPGHVSVEYLAARYQLSRAEVDRLDAFRSRLDKAVLSGIEGKKVTIIGCGSLGAASAKMLLQTGISRLQLIDPDRLGWENIGRHELGAKDVGSNKAEALAAHLRLQFPHIRVDAQPRNWMTVFDHNPELFADSDLVISATGEWNNEAAFDDLRLATTSISCPVIHAWMEDRAFAAHALAIVDPDTSLKSGFSPTGSVSIPASVWDRVPVSRQCGGGPSLYGSIELANAQTLLCGLAIDVLSRRIRQTTRRVWLGKTDDLVNQGGHWNPKWLESHGNPGEGGKVISTCWPKEAESVDHA